MKRVLFLVVLLLGFGSAQTLTQTESEGLLIRFLKRNQEVCLSCVRSNDLRPMVWFTSFIDTVRARASITRGLEQGMSLEEIASAMTLTDDQLQELVSYEKVVPGDGFLCTHDEEGDEKTRFYFKTINDELRICRIYSVKKEKWSSVTWGDEE